MAKPYIPLDAGMVKLRDPAGLFHLDLSDVPALKRAAAACVGNEKAGGIGSSWASPKGWMLPHVQ